MKLVKKVLAGVAVAAMVAARRVDLRLSAFFMIAFFE
jgi:hypothetical protein